MTPLRITAHVEGSVALTEGALAIDALVMWAQSMSLGLAPIGFRDAVDIETPIAMDPSRRFHLASFSVVEWEAHEMRYVNRKFPVEQAQMLGEPSFNRIHISAGAQKSYRLPHNLAFPTGGRMDWYVIGDAGPLEELLLLVTHLGRRRAAGRGKVSRWDVQPFEPWGTGFPVVRDGRALRPLPPEWPGVVDPAMAYATLSPPYWDRTREELCMVPA